MENAYLIDDDGHISINVIYYELNRHFPIHKL